MWVISCVFNWPLCICHIVCKGLVTFGTCKWLPTLCEPIHESSFVILFYGLASVSLPMKRFETDFHFFGTYSILLILHWDLCHSFNIALWTYLTGLPPCVNPFMNLHSLSPLFKGFNSLKLLMKRFGVDYRLFWDLFHPIDFTLGPIPQFHDLIVDLFHRPNNCLWHVAQYFSWLSLMTCHIWNKQKGYLQCGSFHASWRLNNV